MANRWLLCSVLTSVLVALSVRYRHVSSPPPIAPHPAVVLARAIQKSSETQAFPRVDIARVHVVPQQPLEASLTARLALRGTALLPERLAWIEDRVLHRTSLYREHDTIADARLATIGSGIVWLDHAGVLTQLRLEDSRSDNERLDDAPHITSIAIPTRAGQPAMQLVPSHTPEGAFAGLRVESIDDTSWLARLNLSLRPGDLIVAVDGQPLRSPQQTLQVMRKAIHQPDFDLVINRDGHSTTLHRTGASPQFFNNTLSP